MKYAADSTHTYLSNYGRRIKPCFWFLDKDLPAFKKTLTIPYDNVCITNLIIPRGAVIHLDSIRLNENVLVSSAKLRASVAFVYSNIECNSLKECKTTRSTYDFYPNFFYKKGTLVTPKKPFYLGNAECASGIHFFLNVNAALNY